MMSEYITKAQAIKALEDALWDSDSPEDIEFYFESQLKKIEPAEVVDEVYGRWEIIRDPYGEIEGFLCSCGHESLSASNYCPNCGVRKDGEEE